MESIRRWRNAQMEVLRQSEKISFQSQEEYFAREVWSEKDKQWPEQMLLGIHSHGELIGYGGFVNISWPRLSAEISFLLRPNLEQMPRSKRTRFRLFLRSIEKIAFRFVGFQELWTETYQFRSDHIRCLEAEGFVPIESCPGAEESNTGSAVGIIHVCRISG